MLVGIVPVGIAPVGIGTASHLGFETAEYHVTCMASRVNIYSQLVISIIGIVDISNSVMLQFELLILATNC